jgi:hypothetical protein
MKHAATRDVFNYWNERRGRRPAPDRADIEPGRIRRALGDTFILAFDTGADHPFRLAGTRLCALFCRELKGQPFAGLWDETQRAALRELLAIVVKESGGVVAGATAMAAHGASLDLELLLLPLIHGRDTHARVLGVLAPLVSPYWLGTQPLANLRLGTLRHLGPALEVVSPPPLVPMPDATEPRKGFVVHEGGRS